jgi:hypothetical protein
MRIEPPINRPEKGVFVAKRLFKKEKMLKAHLLWLNKTRCVEHGRPYEEHPNCYFQDLEAGRIPQTPETEERIGFFDIEASGLKGTFGYMFTYCIKKLDGPVLKRTIKPSDILPNGTSDQWLDRDLCVQFCEDANQFDRLVVYWGKDKRLDVPFIRTRTVYWQQIARRDGDEEMVEKLHFPEYMELYVEDLYDIVKTKFRLHSNRLGTFCQFMNIPAKFHPLNPEKWNKALAGYQDALDYILVHNVEDVHSTEDAWKLVKNFKNRPRTSI